MGQYINSHIPLVKQSTEPSTPIADFNYVYVNDDDELCVKNDLGIVEKPSLNLSQIRANQSFIYTHCFDTMATTAYRFFRASAITNIIRSDSTDASVRGQYIFRNPKTANTIKRLYTLDQWAAPDNGVFSTLVKIHNPEDAVIDIGWHNRTDTAVVNDRIIFKYTTPTDLILTGSGDTTYDGTYVYQGTQTVGGFDTPYWRRSDNVYYLSIDSTGFNYWCIDENSLPDWFNADLVKIYSGGVVAGEYKTPFGVGSYDVSGFCCGFVGECDNGGSTTQTASNVGLTQDTWYYLVIHISEDRSVVTFKAYTVPDGTLLWSDTITTNIIADSVGVYPSILAYKSSTSTAINDQFSLGFWGFGRAEGYYGLYGREP